MSTLSSPLHDIRVASPCRASWEQMEGNDRMRFCEECALRVYNLSAMTAQEAEHLVMKKEGRLCVRFYQREDGTVLTQDCPRGLIAIQHAARRTSLVIGLSIAAMFLLVFGLLGAYVGISRLGKGNTQPFNGWFNGGSSGGALRIGQPAPIMGDVCPIDEPDPPPVPDEGEPKR